MKVEVNIKNIAWLSVRLIISVLLKLVCKAFGGREIIVMLIRAGVPRRKNRPKRQQSNTITLTAWVKAGTNYKSRGENDSDEVRAKKSARIIKPNDEPAKVNHFAGFRVL